MTKAHSNAVYIVLALIGASISLYGNIQSSPQYYYVLGSIALLIPAIHYRIIYFIALELILASGHTAILLGIGRNAQLALPVLLCLQLFIFYMMIGKENIVLLLIGISGIALLSCGFSYNNQWIFFAGSSFIAIYAYYNAFKGKYAAYIWAILNTLFALSAFYKLFIL